jgi:hypothetical protein
MASWEVSRCCTCMLPYRTQGQCVCCLYKFPCNTRPTCLLLICMFVVCCCAGFCAPPTLTLTLQRSGGRLANSRGSSTTRRPGGSKPSHGANAVLHVALTAAYWLDNRSGLNLVLSDLDRRWLRGLPGSGLKRTSLGSMTACQPCTWHVCQTLCCLELLPCHTGTACCCAHMILTSQ